MVVEKPDDTWFNTTAVRAGGHWFGEFTADMEGTHRIYAVVSDTYGAITSMPIGTVEATTTPNNPPRISSVSISPHKVIQNETVFITIGGEDAEDGTPTEIKADITASDGTVYNYTFAYARFANVIFNTTNLQIGIYNVNVAVKDSQNATTSATVGSFEVERPLQVEPAAAAFPIQEVELGVGMVSLIALIIIALLLWKRTLRTTATAAAAAPAT
jgi:hypothetical protein